MIFMKVDGKIFLKRFGVQNFRPGKNSKFLCSSPNTFEIYD